jgi:hypothetical protein
MFAVQAPIDAMLQVEALSNTNHFLCYLSHNLLFVSMDSEWHRLCKIKISSAKLHWDDTCRALHIFTMLDYSAVLMALASDYATYY